MDNKWNFVSDGVEPTGIRIVEVQWRNVGIRNNGIVFQKKKMQVVERGSYTGLGSYEGNRKLLLRGLEGEDKDNYWEYENAFSWRYID